MALMRIRLFVQVHASETNHILMSSTLPRRCIVGDIGVHNKQSLGISPIHLSHCVLVEMLDKLHHSATDPTSKNFFRLFSLHFSKRLWLYDGLLAKDMDRISFL